MVKQDNNTILAWRAVQQFNKIRPTLQGFVRELTGNRKLIVKPTHGGPQSTADEVWIHVPLEMGKQIPHIREVCYERDAETGWRLCPACDLMDSIMFHTFHETGHALVGGTHDRLSIPERNMLAASVHRAWVAEFPKFAAAKSRKLETGYEIDYAMRAAGEVHEWLNFVFNCTEDLRIDTRMFKVRPGVRDMAYADMMKVLLKGIPTGNDVVRFWKDADEDTQILIAFMSKGLEYPLEYFSESVQEFIDVNPEIDKFIRDALASDTKEESWDVACRMLAWLHSLGRCNPPSEDEEEGEGDDDSGESSDKSGDSQGESDASSSEGDSQSDPSASGSGGSDNKGRPGDDESDEGEPGDDSGEHGRGDIGDDGKAGSGTPSGSDDSSESNTSPSPQLAIACEHAPADEHSTGEPGAKAVETAIVQAMFFDGPSHQVIGLRYHEFGEEEPKDYPIASGWLKSVPEYEKAQVDAGMLGTSVMRAKRVFVENSITKRSKGHTNGKIDGPSLGKRVPFDDARMFGKKTRPKKRSYEVVIMADISGSNGWSGRMSQVKSSIRMLSDLMAKVGVNFSVYGHTCHWGDHDRETYGLDIYPVKRVNEMYGPRVIQKINALDSSDGNLDGHAVEFARKQCDRSDATDKIILYITDGQMPAANKDEEREILVKEIKLIRKKGYVLVGVGMGTDSPSKYGLETVRIDQPADIANVVTLLEKKLTAV